MGPTVCELEGPIPILNRSNRLVFIYCGTAGNRAAAILFLISFAGCVGLARYETRHPPVDYRRRDSMADYSTLMAETPRIQTTTVGSYPIPDWLAASPCEQARLDATRVVFDLQRQARIDLPTDGELYRFDINHPDTNGMIEYFIKPMAGIRTKLGRSELEAFAKKDAMRFRRKPAGVVEGPIGEGSLNLLADCESAASVAQGPFKFTVTSPYMLARTLLDNFYHDFESLIFAIADVLAAQVKGLPCACVQIDEANIPGNAGDSEIAARAMNVVLDRIDRGKTQRAVHLCFGNYGGQVIQTGEWKKLLGFLNGLHVDHLVLELAHRPTQDLDALKDVDPKIGIGIGVVDVKVNHIETASEVASRIEKAERILGPGRVKWVHPDCGFWMLKRSVSDRKMAALAAGRDKYLGIS
jgi:5-methyltetrahydropteroyltriglutamate--homocysteine methyltransferase